MAKIEVKTPSQIKIMAEGGKILEEVFREVLPKIKPGISTLEIDNWIDKLIIQAGAECSFKTVPHYHWASCVGVNDEVVHSIPKNDKIIEEGDLVKVDAGVLWKGYHTDASWTVLMQNSKIKNQNEEERFLEAGKEALKKAIKVVKPGNRIGDISLQIQETIESAGYHPVKLLTGHGIGKVLHEDPMIPCFLKGRREKTPEIVSGMALAIEVIYNQGSSDLVMEDDDWTISTKDGKISALFEETVVVCANEPQILTGIGGLFVC